MAIIELVDRVVTAMENGDFILGIFLDFSKAFDTINHEILLSKLWHYGIRGKSHDWVTSYLSGRKQYVTYNGSQSSQMDINCGVPQGSILGPLLFLVYVNDLAMVSPRFFTIMFADDTNIFLRGNNLAELESMANNELSKILNWLNTNKLSLNIDKTKYMIFGQNKRKQYQPSQIVLKLNDQDIERVNSIKFLGIVIDEKLDWRKNTKMISNKIAKAIGILRKARKCLNHSSLRSLYFSFISSYLSYCIVVWGGTYKVVLDPLVKLQKKAVRIVCCKKNRESTVNLFTELNILPLEAMYQYHVSIFMYKYCNAKLPGIFNNYYVRSDNVHNYFTRQNSDLRTCISIPGNRITNYRKETIHYSGVHIFNKLKQFINFDVSIGIFKRSTKMYYSKNGIFKF